MGGNVKDAFTSEPKVERTCSECGVTFEDTMKYSAKKFCKSCRKRLKTSENLVSNVTAEANTDTNHVEITVSLTSTVDDTLSIPVETEEDGRDELIGLLRVESDTDAWYEDVWVIEDETYDYQVRRGKAILTFEWPIEQPATGLRGEYQSAVGDPFDADELEVSFTFIDPNIEDVTTTLELPEFLIDL